MKRVLFIDDDLLIQKLVFTKLSTEGYQVRVAANGREAKDILTREEFDIIITDIMMPFIGGMELIEAIRLELKLKTPIIVLSSLTQEDNILKAFDLGANDYMIKPFSPKELIIRIKRLTN
ncbi:MAG TPA: response regulator transcription factor [Bacteroidia bacterium]|nr:response regulator transcription factor [Bacteroidia bacterium]HRS59469.1 response regulator transcription factor [Bacteroidia bacterium]HRU67771.1 response regulator transcription factor [Bacteroidia bacterium]